MKEKPSLEEFEDWFEDNGIESMETIAELFKVQQQGAIDLTKLVLEYCKSDEMTKDYVFKTYGEALNVIKATIDKDV